MPIKGMTDKVEARLPRLGVLRKGMAVEKIAKSGKPYKAMVDLEYFRFTAKDPAIEAAFREAYGAEPRSINVWLADATTASAFQSWREEWGASGLIHRCDGETMVRWRTHDGKFSTEPRPCPYHTGEKTRDPKARPPALGCVQVGRLTLFLPKLLERGYAGTVTLITHSINDIIAIQNALEWVEGVRVRSPLGLRGIEFRLWRELTEISTPTDDGGRVTREKSLVYITPAQTWVEAQYQLMRSQQMLALPATTATVSAEDAAIERAVEGAPAGYSDEDDDEPVEAQFLPVDDDEETPAAPTRRPTLQEALDAAPKAQAPSPPAYFNGAETVKAELLRLAHEYDRKGRNSEPAPNKVGLLMAKLNEVFGPGDAGSQKRHLVLQFVFGKASSKELCDAEVMAMLDTFVGPLDAATRTYPLKPGAKERLGALLEKANETEGQLAFA